MAEDHPPSSTPPDHQSPDHEQSDHKLTGMESFFDNLFNEHMVLPPPSEASPPIDGVDESGRVEEEGVGPTGGAG
jgi:hypothetical protein